MNIAHNLEKVMSTLRGETIVAATKYVDVDTMKVLLQLGIHDFGENRVQDFLRKKIALENENVVWHFIGHLQTNKVKQVINEIDVLHSLDRMSLAMAIQKERSRPLDCFVEVNISHESSKTGMDEKEVMDFIINCQKYDRINIVGLMGMASNSQDELLIEEQFMSLYRLQQKLQATSQLNIPLPYLSMGMSNDYLIAIRCHATHLRLGTILFRNEES